MAAVAGLSLTLRRRGRADRRWHRRDAKTVDGDPSAAKAAAAEEMAKAEEGDGEEDEEERPREDVIWHYVGPENPYEYDESGEEFPLQIRGMIDPYNPPFVSCSSKPLRPIPKTLETVQQLLQQHREAVRRSRSHSATQQRHFMEHSGPLQQSARLRRPLR